MHRCLTRQVIESADWVMNLRAKHYSKSDFRPGWWPFRTAGKNPDHEPRSKPARYAPRAERIHTPQYSELLRSLAEARATRLWIGDSLLTYCLIYILFSNGFVTWITGRSAASSHRPSSDANLTMSGDRVKAFIVIRLGWCPEGGLVLRAVLHKP
jgi:hypothetical protein